MRFARLIAAGVGVVAVVAGGVFLFAPAASGQERRVFLGAPEADIEVFGGGGSRIGVSVRDLDQADVTREKLAGLAGAVVEEVRSETPAAKAGLKSGDVIVAFDGERVRSARQLERLVAETPAGRAVKVAVQRAGSKLDLDVTPEAPRNALHGPFKFEPGEMGELVGPRVEREIKRAFPAREFHFEMPEGSPGWSLYPGQGRLGVQVQDLSDSLAAHFGAKSGVIVADVDQGSAAEKAGVKVADVITAVNGEAISDAGDLRRAVAKAAGDGKTAELSVLRDKKPLTLKVEPDAAKSTRPRVRRTV
jgi:serine protease Do